MSQLGKGVMSACIATGVLVAIGAVLVADQLALSLALGAAAAGFLTFAGLVALADRMPSLPPLVVPARSVWQGNVRRALAGDRLARLQVLEMLDRIHGTSTQRGERLLQDDRKMYEAYPREKFASFVDAELLRAEGEG